MLENNLKNEVEERLKILYSLLKRAQEKTNNPEVPQLHAQISELEWVLELVKPAEEKYNPPLRFETSVGKVKCHDESSVVFFSYFPDASTYVGKRVKVSLTLLEDSK